MRSFRAPGSPPARTDLSCLLVLSSVSDRQTFLIAPDGIIKAKWLERDGSMASVKTMDHANQVLDKIKELKG